MAQRDSNSKELTDVAETLFIPLYCRALETESENPIISDPKAVEIFKQLNVKPQFQRKQLLVMIAARTKVFDEIVSAFLSRAPDGIIVNMGCGLDTRFSRIDNGRCTWYDLDFPEVIEIRKRFFKENERHRTIASSVLDFKWMDEVRRSHPGKIYLFLAEGLFMYLQGNEVKSIVLRLRDLFPGSQLAFEACSSFGVRMAKSKLGRRKFQRRFKLGKEAIFNWGIENSLVLESWHSGIKLLNEFFYFKRKEKKWGWYRLLFKFKKFGEIMWIAQYRLE